METATSRADDGVRQLMGSVQAVGVLRHRLAAVAGEQREQGDVVSGTVGALSERISHGAGELVDLAEVAERVDAQAASGRELMTSLVGEMRSTAEAVQTSAWAIRELGGLVREIGAVAKAIDQLSTSTARLAINARIEAARAGEAGKGFAVVANEVRELSALTARQASRIAETVGVIDSLVAKAGRSASTMGADEASLERRKVQAEGASQAFTQILEDVSQLSSRTISLAGATRQHASELGLAAEAVSRFAATAGVAQRCATDLSTWSGSLDMTAALLARRDLDLAGVEPDAGAALLAVSTTLQGLVEVPVEHAGRTVARGDEVAAAGRRFVASDLDVLDGPMSVNLRRHERALCGVTVTLAQGTATDQPLVMHWWVHDHAGVHRHHAQLDRSAPDFYDYTQADWFRRPQERGTIWYSDPYFDEGGADRDIVTISVPFAGSIRGVATADLSLDQIQQLVRPDLQQLGRPAVLVGEGGVVVASVGHADARPGQQLGGSVYDDPETWRVVRSSRLPWHLVTRRA